MKITRLLGFILFGMILSIQPYDLYSQNQSIVFNGIDQYMSFDASTKLPKRNINRTVQFWLKASAFAGAELEPLVILGEPDKSGSTFAIVSQFTNGKRTLAIWEGEELIHEMLEIRDEQWHFAAFVLNGNTIQAYLDGELFAVKNLIYPISLSSTKAYVAGMPTGSTYFKGAIDNLSIWNQARSQDQIRSNMRGYPVIQGDETGLAAYFPFDETPSQQMASPTQVEAPCSPVRGSLQNGATWSRSLSSDPNMLEEGIWFAIQNKVNTDTDFDIPAARIALKADGGNFSMEAAPLTGNYDAFLWRLQAIEGQEGSFQLINKSFEDDQALGYANNMLQVVTKDPQVSVGDNQRWEIDHKNIDIMGTNVYGIRNAMDNQVLEMNDLIGFGAEIQDAVNQAWVFQPLGVQLGYHIPNSPETITTVFFGTKETAPFTRSLALDLGFTLYATNTASEWAMLNAHLVLNNMMHALKPENKILMADYLSQEGSRKEAIMTTRFDLNEAVAAYPLFSEIFNLDWITRFRGGAGNDPNRLVSFTWFSEEITWKRGSYHNPSDDSPRESEHAVHEFAHTIDVGCNLRTFALPQTGGSREPFAWWVQHWFNSAHSAGAGRNRAVLAQTPNDYSFVAGVFEESNTWLPSRQLRDFQSTYPFYESLYCDAEGQEGTTADHITFVSLNDLSNSSEQTRYTDFTQYKATLQAGQIYTLQVGLDFSFRRR